MNEHAPIRATLRQREESARRVFAVGRRKGGKARVYYRCSWCMEWIGDEPTGNYVESTSHGMCEECADTWGNE